MLCATNKETNLVWEKLNKQSFLKKVIVKKTKEDTPYKIFKNTDWHMVFNKLYFKILFIKQRTTFKITTITQGEGEDQIRSVAQSCPTLCDPMNRSTPGLPVHHQLPEFAQTHVHRVSDAIQPSHPLSSPSPLAPNPSQHQGLFQWVNSSHEVAKVLEFQL